MAVVEPMQPVPFRVTGAKRETADVTTLWLLPVEAVLPAVQPGQFMMVWAFGVGEVPISVSATGPGGAVVITVRSVGAVSAAIVACRVGDVLGLRGPFGTVWPVAAAAGRDLVVVAGGLGLAPLRLAIDALVSAAGAEKPSRVSVVVGARDPAQLLYPADVERWRAVGAAVHLTVDHSDRTWHGAVGTTTAMLQRLAEAHDMAFVCGPGLMMTSGARAVISRGVQPADVWVSLERNMHCGIGHCGRCQIGPHLLCRDGAIVRFDGVGDLLEVRGR
jgi:NAD(P)H-flavin reductase